MLKKWIIGVGFLVATLISLPPMVSAKSVKSQIQAHVNWAWANHGPCTDAVLCALHVRHVGIKFEDGIVYPVIGVQRLTTSAHDCIVRARRAKADGKRELAVEWVMASQIHNKDAYELLFMNPDLVLAALDRVR